MPPSRTGDDDLGSVGIGPWIRAPIAIAASGSASPGRRRRWLRRLHARLMSAGLDARLVAGEDPVLADLLAVRATQLLSRRERDKLASAIERLLAKPRRRPSFSAAIPVDGRAVEIAGPALEQLA